MAIGINFFVIMGGGRAFGECGAYNRVVGTEPLVRGQSRKPPEAENILAFRVQMKHKFIFLSFKVLNYAF